MHELGIMTRVLEVAQRVSEENGGGRVTAIELEVGVMSGIVAAHAQKFFALVSKGTVAEGASLNLVPVPAHFACSACGHEMLVHTPGTEFFCEACGSGDLRLDTGLGLHMTSVTMI